MASLSKLIEPLLPALQAERSLTLFTIAVSWKGDADQVLPRRLCQELRQVIVRCTLPERDVLLPQTSDGCPGELAFMLAAASELGAGVLSKRLRDQMQRWEQIQHTGLALSVSYKFLDLTSRESDGGDDLLQIVVRRVEESLQAERRTRALDRRESS